MHSLAIKEPVKTIFIVLILCHSIPLRKYMKQELIVPGLAKVVWHRGKAVVLYPTNAAATFIAVLALRGRPATPAANVLWGKGYAPRAKFPPAKSAKATGWDGPMTVQNALPDKNVRWDSAFPFLRIPIVPPKPVLRPDMNAARGMTPAAEFLIAARARRASRVPRRANALTAPPRRRRTLKSTAMTVRYRPSRIP